jgi:hypothetical protein
MGRINQISQTVEFRLSMLMLMSISMSMSIITRGGTFWVISFSQQHSNQEIQTIEIGFVAEEGRGSFLIPSLFLGRGSSGVDPDATTGMA